MVRSLAPVRTFLLVAALCGGCKKQVVDPVREEVDFGDPKSVTAALFWAAAHDDDTHLASLCDPAGENDAETARVCGLRRGAPDWAAFRAAFAEATLNGEPRISGDRASIYLVYGAGRAETETMELVRREGRWYLFEF